MTTRPEAIASPNEASRRAAARLQEFRGLHARGALCTELTRQLATEAAENFLGHFRKTREYLADCISLLAEIATLEEPCLSQPGQRATFPLLVEKLSDSFEPEMCDLYESVFSQMISIARRQPRAARVDAALRRFGIAADQDLLDRRARISQHSAWRNAQGHSAVQKVLVLSRVTLGADVAITSVVLQQARQLFPQAQIVLFAPAKARELFGGDASLQLRDLAYPGDGSLIGRLESWVDLVELVQDEAARLHAAEYILLDPDSRYLQLGLLPVLKDESRYFLFESRRAGGGGGKSLSRLAAEWMHETFGNDSSPLPKVHLREPDVKLGRELTRRLRAGGAKAIVAVSFGAGGNDDKRLPDPFEIELLARLIRSGATVILDHGVAEDEARRTGQLAEALRRQGGMVMDLDASRAAGPGQDASLQCSLLTWKGGIGTWAGLIAASDEYIGYDSSGQHIAAALGVPAIGIFSAGTTPRFRQRWHPAGPGIVRVVAEKAAARGGSVTKTLEEVMRASQVVQNAKDR